MCKGETLTKTMSNCTYSKIPFSYTKEWANIALPYINW